MRKTFVLTLMLAAALLAATTASARSNPEHQRVVRLAKEVKVLRHRLHNMTLARNAAQKQSSALATALAQRTRERDVALARAAALDAQIASIPVPLTVAVQQVQNEVAWAKGGSSYSVGTLTALAALDYAVGHVSVGEYGYLEIAGLPLPAHTPNAVLAAQAGLCGETSLVFAVIMQHLGYETRRIAFYWTLADGTPDGHTAVEVHYDGSWHYFDPTFAQYWTDGGGNVMSITDVRSQGGTRHKNDFTFTNLIENPWFGGDDTAFETDPATSVVVGGDPFVG
jgi:Transglutaminase-like superfamily